jgi:hypothetical protein
MTVSIRDDANHCANVLPHRIGIRDGTAGFLIKAPLKELADTSGIGSPWLARRCRRTPNRIDG